MSAVLSNRCVNGLGLGSLSMWIIVVYLNTNSDVQGCIKIVNYGWRTQHLLYKTVFLKLCNALCRKRSRVNKHL